jgi:glycosyltransferase involved in cell wall biosynthesis
MWVRVAVVHSFYSSLQPSGENNVVVDQLKQLQEHGHDVQLVSRSTDEHIDRFLHSLRSAMTVVSGRGPTPHQDLLKFRPDVVHVHNLFPNFGTSWVPKWHQRLVATVHNYRPMCSNGLLFRDGHPCTDCVSQPVLPAVSHACYRSSRAATLPVAIATAPVGSLRVIPRLANRLIALNDHSADVYRSVFRREVEVVPNFVIDSGLGPSMPHRRFLYVGRLSPEKGIEELLARWPAGMQLDIIGDGPLSTRVQDHAMRSNGTVHVLGLRPRNELLRALPSYRALIVPSMCQEQLPTTVLEAIAAGVPVVLSNFIAAADDFAKNGAAATFRPDAASASLSAALAQVEGGGAHMRSSARRLFEHRYSAARWQAAIDRIYDEVATSVARPRSSSLDDG